MARYHSRFPRGSFRAREKQKKKKIKNQVTRTKKSLLFFPRRRLSDTRDTRDTRGNGTHSGGARAATAQSKQLLFTIGWPVDRSVARIGRTMILSSLLSKSLLSFSGVRKRGFFPLFPAKRA